MFEPLVFLFADSRESRSQISIGQVSGSWPAIFVLFASLLWRSMKVGPRFTVATKMVGGRASVFFEEHTPVKTHGTSRMRLEDEFAAANYNFEISITFNDGIWKNKTWFP